MTQTDRQGSVEGMNDFGAPTQSGFYAGSFEKAQQSGVPLYAVAFRRSARSAIEVLKLDVPEQAGAVMANLALAGVLLCDMWPLVICVGGVESITVAAKMPAVSSDQDRGPGTP